MIFLRISLHCKLVPVLYREYEYDKRMPSQFYGSVEIRITVSFPACNGPVSAHILKACAYLMASNIPFPEFKQTGDDKHDLETYIEDLTDYCVMQSWFDSLKETDAQKWTKPEKAVACLRASLSPAARTVYKYSLGLDEADQKKPHCVVAALREYYDASVGVSGERQKFLRLLQNENESIASWETRVRNQAAQCEYEGFADELMTDQFIAGLTSDTL